MNKKENKNSSKHQMNKLEKKKSKDKKEKLAKDERSNN